ncbi:hypothetical protein ILT44_08790 [Microvirga sp. BT689]|nr:hypothetical protein [Microvirga arvi]MBM6580276.1 hypothetical protein [Microvirga arvi]
MGARILRRLQQWRGRRRFVVIDRGTVHRLDNLSGQDRHDSAASRTEWAE